MRTAQPRGFTLIELMVVVCVIGLLSSVAIPSFRNMQLRSKQAERSVMTTSIRRAIDEYWAREGHYPIVNGVPPNQQSWLYLFYWNPDDRPTPQKRAWRQKPLNQWDHWNNLSLMVEGSVYYSYYGYAYDLGSVRYTLVYTKGDLDGDGVQDEDERYWYYQDNKLEKWAGGNCEDCTYRWRFPGDGQVF